MVRLGELSRNPLSRRFSRGATAFIGVALVLLTLVNWQSADHGFSLRSDVYALSSVVVLAAAVYVDRIWCRIVGLALIGALVVVLCIGLPRQLDRFGVIDPHYPLPSVCTAALELLVVGAALLLAFRRRRGPARHGPAVSQTG